MWIKTHQVHIRVRVSRLTVKEQPASFFLSFPFSEPGWFHTHNPPVSQVLGSQVSPGNLNVLSVTSPLTSDVPRKPLPLVPGDLISQVQ